MISVILQFLEAIDFHAAGGQLRKIETILRKVQLKDGIQEGEKNKCKFLKLKNGRLAADGMWLM